MLFLTDCPWWKWSANLFCQCLLTCFAQGPLLAFSSLLCLANHCCKQGLPCLWATFCAWFVAEARVAVVLCCHHCVMRAPLLAWFNSACMCLFAECSSLHPPPHCLLHNFIVVVWFHCWWFCESLRVNSFMLLKSESDAEKCWIPKVGINRIPAIRTFFLHNFWGSYGIILYVGISTYLS